MMARRRSISLAALPLAAMLIAGAAFTPGATAQTAPAIPAAPQITDPAGDSNFANDQDNANVCSPTPCERIAPLTCVFTDRGGEDWTRER